MITFLRYININKYRDMNKIKKIRRKLSDSVDSYYTKLHSKKDNTDGSDLDGPYEPVNPNNPNEPVNPYGANGANGAMMPYEEKIFKMNFTGPINDYIPTEARIVKIGSFVSIHVNGIKVITTSENYFLSRDIPVDLITIDTNKTFIIPVINDGRNMLGGAQLKYKDNEYLLIISARIDPNCKFKRNSISGFDNFSLIV